MKSSVHTVPAVAGISILAVAMSSLASAGQAGVAPVGPVTGVVPIPRIVSYTLQELDLPSLEAAAPGHPALPVETATVSVVLDAEPVDLVLRKHSMRAPDFQLLVQREDGELRPEPAPPVSTYRGHVTGYPGSTVTALMHDDKLTAHIELSPDLSQYVVQPASDFDADLPAGSHVSFRAADVSRLEQHCGVTDGPRELAPAPEQAGPADGTGFEKVELAIDSDNEFFNDNGTVTAALFDVEGVLNTVEFVYERDTDITYEVTFIVLRTSDATDPYTATTADGLLCQFGAVWNSAPESAAKRDVAQLFTGKNLAGGTIGLAWNAVICNGVGFGCGSNQNLSYSIVETSFSPVFDSRVSLSAHELGHNWNAPHCNGIVPCHIMCATSGLCQGDTGSNLKFGNNSINFITAYRNTRACLDDEPSPLSPPFLEDVPTTTIDTDKWTWNNLSSVGTSSSNPPSPPYALRLFSFGINEFRDSDLRSNEILLAGVTNYNVSYFTQHVGVEAGESLEVEYWGADLRWYNLNSVISDGVDQTEFDGHEHTLNLAAEAYHDDFRLRFRTQGDQSNDIWYVDNVRIGPVVTGACCSGELCVEFTEVTCISLGGTYQGDTSTCAPTNPCAPPPACPEDLNGNLVVDFADILAVIAAWGPCGVPCPEDLSGNGQVDFADILAVIAAWGPCP
ncbi:MAG: hypothetical protein GY715_03300 [Planctomycetes bacterium]|nr:hypothetical protein [Planctomycetota bacterium]